MTWLDFRRASERCMALIVTIRMTWPELAKLLAYVNARDQGTDSGWYYAPKKSFEARHKSIKEILERVLTVQGKSGEPNT